MNTTKKINKFILVDAMAAKEDEVTDTVGDFLQTTAVIDKRLSDGFQPWEDLIAIGRQEGDVRDMINSFPTFAEQLKSLTPELALSAIASAEERAKKAVGGELGKASNFVLYILRNSASNYAFVRSTISKVQAIIDEGQQQLALWQTSPL